MQIREGLHYNPYFPGGAIAMPKMLIDGAVEYEDGTPATESQVLTQILIQNLSLLPFLIIYFHLTLFLKITDGKGCCGIFIMGCRTGNGGEETGKTICLLSSSPATITLLFKF